MRNESEIREVVDTFCTQYQKENDKAADLKETAAVVQKIWAEKFEVFVRTRLAHLSITELEMVLAELRGRNSRKRA